MLPLKSGADLYNQEAARMRLHNLGADPTEVGAGLIYYNTSSGLSTSQQIRFHTGTAWKTLAFAEDLDVASNADFLALKSKVDAFLEGGVDSDGVLENLKEIQAFLDNYSSATDLSEILDTKLDKTGGTIKNGSKSNPFNIDTDATDTLYVSLKSKGEAKAYFVWNAGQGVYLQDSAVNRLGLLHDGTPHYYNGNVAHTLLHSGNIGSYNAGSASTLKGIYKDTFDANQCYNTSCLVKFYSGFSPDSANIPDSNSWFHGLLEIGLNSSGAVSQFFFVADKPLYYRASNTSAWKTIAFTDSTVDAANRIVTSNGKYMIYQNTNGHLYVGDNLGTNDTYIIGGSVKLRYGAEATYGFILNSSGNVTIGGSDLAGTGAKLYVDGHIKLGASGYLYKNDKTVIDFAGDAPLFGYGTAAAGLGTKVYGFDIRLYYGGTTNVGFILNNFGNVLIGTTDDNGSGAKLQVEGHAFISNTVSAGSYFDLNRSAISGVISDTTRMALEMQAQATSIRFSLFDKNGLWKGIPMEFLENGDVHVSGNLIVDGEVSAGGEGTEGGNAGGGSGAFYSTTIATQTTSKAIAHNLGTEDIVVSIYEKNGTSGNWEMILTDVEIEDANNIVVSFGSATNVEHKVVIMGAVA